ncbi:MAG: DUF4493 domain-containing protein [Bacteroidales bacterium]|nr:DUF4493 domain-containing protein [Bacteroidales bacterium]
MNTKSLLTMAFAALLAVSCSKTKSAGGLNFSVVAGQIDEVVTKGQVSDYVALPATSAFTLVVKDGKGQTIYNGLLTDWNPETQLQSGNYTAQASYGSDTDEGIAKPYFVGTEEFSITGGQTTDVVITVSLGNAIVKVVATDNFKKYYPTYSFKVTTPENIAGFDCTDSSVFVSWKFTVAGTVTSQSGKTQTLEAKNFQAEAATCYTVKYDVTNVGGVSVTVSFNDTVDTVNLGEIELND